MGRATCCDAAPITTSPGCPVSGFRGEPVGWRTVAALVAGVLPARQDFWVCRDPGCSVVYFGSAGAQIGSSALRVLPGFKAGGALLCYCFLVSESDLSAELAAIGKTDVVDRISASVRARQCACEVRNPTGKCCLPDVKRATTRLLRPAAL